MVDKVEVVNVVGSGNLGVELDLQEVYQSIDPCFAGYHPESHPGLQIRLREEGPLITLYRTGSFTIVGAKSEQDLFDERDSVVEYLSDNNIIPHLPFDDQFTVSNIVCVADLGIGLDLERLSILLGLENTEYEPEQSPFLVYRPKDYTFTMTIPSNGKIMITGIQKTETAEEALRMLKEQLGK